MSHTQHTDRGEDVDHGGQGAAVDGLLDVFLVRQEGVLV